MVKVFIAENVPSLNKGEATILEGMLETFKVLGNAEVTMLSELPHIDQPRYETMVNIIDVSKYSQLPARFSNQAGKLFSSLFFFSQHLFFLLVYKLFGSKSFKLMKSQIWKVYVESDVIIVGHNGAFGIGGGLGNPIVFYPLFIPIFAKMMGKPVMLYAGSIGQPKKYRWIVGKAFKFALNKVDLITLRERISYQNLKALGIQGDKILVTADPAFLLKPASSERVREIMRQEGIEEDGSPLIGITVTRSKASSAFPEFNNIENRYNKHIEMLAEVVDNLVDNFGARVVFVPHCIGYAKRLDDRIVANDIFQKCRSKHKVKVIATEYSAAELKGLIGQFDFFIGERLHSVVNAMSMGVPSIVISNSADQRLDIIRMLGQDDAICYVENLDSEALLAKIYDMWSRRDKIKEELKAQTQLMQERAMLNGKLLKELLDARQVGKC